MRRLAALFALCWMCASSAASAAWTEVRTPHYLFYGDASRGDMRRIAQRFEQFHAVMQQVLSRASLSFSAPTVVLVFRDMNAFRPYMPRYQGKPVEVAGLAFGGSDVNYVALTAVGGAAAYPIVFHELAHLITLNVSQNSAAWFMEGVAEYYSSFEVRGDDEVLLGMPIGRHAAVLREQFMPIRELLQVDRTSPTYNEQNRSTVFYAESWALLHYLRFNPATRERLPEFIKLAEAGTPHEEAIKQAFGLDLPTIENALRNYVRRLTMPVERRLLDTPLTDADVDVSEVDPNSVVPHLANLLIRLERPDEAEQRLQPVAQQLPKAASVQAVLARLRLEQGRPAEALEILRRDLSYDGFMDHYLVASALARYLFGPGAGNADGSTTSLFRQRASAATEAQGDVPEAWRLASYAHLLEDDVDKAGAAIDRALVLAPANQHYRLLQAEVHVRRRDFTRARALLGALMARGRTPETRDEARRMMGQVVRYEEALKRAQNPQAAAGTEPPRGNATDSPPASPEALPVFRDPGGGETRVFGMLAGIECGPGRVTLVVRADGRVVRVTTAAFERIDFVSFRNDLTGQVSCAARVPPDPVYVTWVGPDNATGEIRSDSVIVEFTPLGYRPH